MGNLSTVFPSPNPSHKGRGVWYTERMEFALTWNLVLVSILTMLFAYAFLLGQDKTIKLIISIYIAIMTADGAAALLKWMIETSPGLGKLLGEGQTDVFIAIRVVLLLASIVIFVIKGGFHIKLDYHDHWMARMGIHMAFAALSSTLLVATGLIYLAGHSFVEGMIFAKDIKIYEESFLAQIMIDYYQFWFSLPAVAFLVASFFFEPKKS